MGTCRNYLKVVVSYDLYSPFVREMVKTWSSSNKAISYDWLQLISVVLEDGPQILWKCYWWEEARILEQQGKAKGFEAPQDQILGEGAYADPQGQALYNEDILSLCHTEVLNAWDRFQELGK